MTVDVASVVDFRQYISHSKYHKQVNLMPQHLLCVIT